MMCAGITERACVPSSGNGRCGADPFRNDRILTFVLFKNSECVDKDECADMPAICGARGICRNDPGGYHCECPRGYRRGMGDACIGTIKNLKIFFAFGCFFTALQFCNELSSHCDLIVEVFKTP